MIFSTSFLDTYTQFRQMLGRHPGLIPLMRIDSEVATELKNSAAHNQATRVTLREERPGTAYDPVRKQAETFRSPFRAADNLGAPETDKTQAQQPHVSSHDRELQELSASLADAEYLERRPEVRDALIAKRKLHQEISSPRIPTGQQLRSYLAESAHRRAGAPTQPDQEKLERDSDLATWIAEDRAGIAGLMAEHGTEVTRNAAPDSWGQVRDQIATEAAGWFDEGSTLDREFFQKYPTAAYYLSQNPALVEDLQKHGDTARKFTARFERIHQRLLPGLAELAAQRADSPGQYNQRWFEQHQEQTILVETARQVIPEKQLASVFSGKPLQTDYSDQKLAGEWERAAADNVLRQAELPDAWVKDHGWLPRLVNRSDQFADQLLSVADRLKTELEQEKNPGDNSWWTIRLAEALDIELPSLHFDRRA
jgi:hypothetical protein